MQLEPLGLPGLRQLRDRAGFVAVPSSSRSFDLCARLFACQLLSSSPPWHTAYAGVENERSPVTRNPSNAIVMATGTLFFPVSSENPYHTRLPRMWSARGSFFGLSSHRSRGSRSSGGKTGVHFTSYRGSGGEADSTSPLPHRPTYFRDPGAPRSNRHPPRTTLSRWLFDSEILAETFRLSRKEASEWYTQFGVRRDSLVE